MCGEDVSVYPYRIMCTLHDLYVQCGSEMEEAMTLREELQRVVDQSTFSDGLDKVCEFIERRDESERERVKEAIRFGRCNAESDKILARVYPPKVDKLSAGLYLARYKSDRRRMFFVDAGEPFMPAVDVEYHKIKNPFDEDK